MRERLRPQRSQQVMATLAALLTCSVGLAQNNGCVDFCAKLSEPEGNRLQSELNRRQIIAELAKAEDDNAVLRYGGYGAKTMSYVVGAISSGAELGGPNMKVAGAVAGAIESPLADAAEHMASLFEESVTKAVVIKLDRTVTDILSPDGRINRERLAKVTSGELSFVYSPEFRAEIGNPALLSTITDKITGAQLSEVLQDTAVIKETLPAMQKRLVLLDDGLSVIKGQMSSLSDQSMRTRQRLDVVEGKVDRAKVVVDAMANAQLSPAQVLALSRSGALTVSGDEEMRLQTLADAQRMQAEFADAQNKMVTVARGLALLPGMEDAAGFVNTTAGMFQSAGALAIAYTTGDVWGGASTAISLVGQISGLGRKKNKNSAMMREMFLQLQQIRQEMEQNHQEVIAKLNSIDGKVDNLQRQLQQSTIRLTIDIAGVQFGINDLLKRDVGPCEGLDEDYRAVAGKINSRVQFARWFENSGRNMAWQNCMVGLQNSLRVKSETNFSDYLVVQPEDAAGGVADFDDPRAPIRSFLEGTLGPTVAYAKRHRAILESKGAETDLFTPTFSICEVAGVAAGSGVCQSKRVENWRPSGLPATTFNPGNGYLISEEKVMALARYAQTISVWETALVERPSRSVPTVIADDELSRFSGDWMGGRTRHLKALRSSLDALDLVIAQSELVSGAPFINYAVDQLEKDVLPAYARLRFLGDEKPLRRLLEPGMAATFPSTLPKCSTGAPAFDTLCLMQTNRWFAENVVKGLVARRLAARGMDAVSWNSVARLPVSVEASQALGEDVVLVEASIPQFSSSFGLWAIQLPRVGIRPVQNANGQMQNIGDCWTAGEVPDLASASEFKAFYAKRSNASCYMLPLVANGGIDRMRFPSNLSAVAIERMQIVEKLKELCKSLRTYPDHLCAEFR